MKKLIMTAAIVCAAVAVEAASFQWASSDKAYMPYAITALSVGENQAAATSGNSNSLQNWAGAGATFTYTMLINGAESSGAVVTSSRYIQTDANNDGFVLPTEGTKNIAWDIVITGTYTKDDVTWTMVSDHITGSKDYTALSTAQIQTGVPTSWTITKSGGGDTPEPTSGLLLLLGVAGLALRRKQK